jgi:hypothetical protein
MRDSNIYYCHRGIVGYPMPWTQYPGQIVNEIFCQRSLLLL